jgi:TPR repeat protein
LTRARTPALETIMFTTRTAAAMLAVALLLTGCGHPPDRKTIESAGKAAIQQNDEAAERRLAGWANDDDLPDLPVAQRELARVYQAHPRPGRGLLEARALFERAASAGDRESAFQLGEMTRSGAAGGKASLAAAIPWYRQAAEADHAKAALALALLYRNGDGVEPDRETAAHWLSVAAKGGNAQAMFLLSNAYAGGDGVPADPRHARALLERAADKNYPDAVRQLAAAK